MAKMYPSRPQKDTESNAERKVFYSLKDLLSDDYTVIHSLSVYKKSNRNSPLHDGEIDFLIIHPDKGMLALEVKGGGVEIDSAAGEWYSTDYRGIRHRIKNPYEQSKKHIHTLAREIENHAELRRFCFPFGHAVWFPDLDLTGKNLGMSSQLKNITMDATDLSRVSNAIPQVFRNAIGENPRKVPTVEGVKVFQKFYAPSRTIQINMSSKIATEKKEFFEATKSQYKILSLLARFRRVSISGAAGCGKTFLALEKARRIVEEDSDKKVLIVCFNNVLAKVLRKMNPEVNQIDVFHFHGLCTEFCRKANFDIPEPDPHGDKGSFFRNELPDCLIDALGEIDDRYDALIVDEGQDFSDSWWLPLQEVLEEPEEGMFYIFFDDNQKIYGDVLQLPFGCEPSISLDENCRNSKCIHNESMKYYKGVSKPYAIGPEGRSPELIKLKNDETEYELVDKITADLLKTEKMTPDDITILTPRHQTKSVWNGNIVLSNRRVTWDINQRGNGKIFCSTIHAFKGLESPVIIITELASIFSSQREELMYVATTRANSHLVIIDT